MSLKVEDFLEFQKCVVADLKMLQDRQRTTEKFMLGFGLMQLIGLILFTAHLFGVK